MLLKNGSLENRAGTALDSLDHFGCLDTCRRGPCGVACADSCGGGKTSNRSSLPPPSPLMNNTVSPAWSLRSN